MSATPKSKLVDSLVFAIKILDVSN